MRWLADFVETELPPREFAHRLTMAGLEAEKIETIGEGWDRVFVGEVEAVARHPDADRLVLATVAAGAHRLTVVTGAPNIAQGQKVALALVGARLIDGHSEGVVYKTLKAGTIRGVRSEGMVCSEKELGLSEEHEGIMVLPDEAPVGAPLASYLGDTVVEFEITPNLVHAFSILGIAREAAALTERPLTLPPAADLAAAPRGGVELARIEAPDLCPRLVAVAIDGASVAPSPDWLARRLRAAGVRPINNLVDVTNYVMLEYGQPLHAYDRDRLAGGGIVARRAEAGETIETLDHQQRRLTDEMLVIADAERAVGVAGVMGGVDSEVADETTTVLLEAANFEMKSIRRTARALKLRTDASARFERGLDPNLPLAAAARATALILELCPGSRVVAVGDVYPEPVEPREVALRFGEIERLLGVAFPPVQVLDVLRRLGFGPTLDGEGAGAILRVRVPTFRSDVTQAADVVEEVARIVGYDALPETLPRGDTTPVARDPAYLFERGVREVLVGAGYFETVNYVTVDDAELRRLAAADGAVGFLHAVEPGAVWRLRNPLQSDRDVLRPTLLPALLGVAAENLKHETGVRLFEIARVYLPNGEPMPDGDRSGGGPELGHEGRLATDSPTNGGGLPRAERIDVVGREAAGGDRPQAADADVLPREANVAGIVVVGRRDPVDRFAADGELDYFDLKGIVDALLLRLGVRDAYVERTAYPALHPGRAAALCLGGRRVGLLGEVRPDVAAAFGIEGSRLTVAELDLDALRAAVPDADGVTVPRFLPVEQDFAIVVADETPAAAVEAALLAGAGPLATGVALFDVYRGPQVGEGRKSLAYRVTFTAPDRALTDGELVKVRGRIGKSLAQRVQGELRG